MPDVTPRDILLRVSAKNLERFQSLAVAGAGRGRGVPLPYTFTRATVKRAYRDRDGIARRASAGNLGIDWPTGLVDASGNALGGPLLEGARNQLVTDPENFGAWTPVTVTLTPGQADPFGGTAAYLLTPAAGSSSIFEVVTFTGNATKNVLCFMRAGTSAQSAFYVFDVTAAVNRHIVLVTWTNGVPTLSTGAGAGTKFAVIPMGDGWYALAANADSIVATNTNRYGLRPDASNGTGTVYVFGANAWNAPFPQSYQAPGEATGVADALTSPVNWGANVDVTVLVRLARPLHADAGASTALGVSPGIFSLGAGTAPRIGLYFDPAARNIISAIDTATTDTTQTTAIPAGQPTVCVQYRNLTTGGSTRMDTGSGFTAWSSAATAFSAFSSQVLRVGRYDDELYGVIGDLIVARGVDFTRAEMLSIL